MKNVEQKLRNDEIMCITITTLIENTGMNDKLENEHGLSFHIQAENTAILFDTGQTDKFMSNAHQLGIDLNRIDHVVISHGHYDHGGGFKAFATTMKNTINLHISDSFFSRKYTYKNGEYLYKGVDFDYEFLKKNHINTNFVRNKIKYIAKDVFLASKFPLQDSCETVSKNMLLKIRDKYVQDAFMDEMVLCISTFEGLIVIVGCAHPGIINILSTLIERTGEKIHMVIGGTHLVHANDARIDKTVDFLNNNHIQYIGLSHCTGNKAVEEFENRVKGYFPNNTGTVIEIGKYGEVKVLPTISKIK